MNGFGAPTSLIPLGPGRKGDTLSPQAVREYEVIAPSDLIIYGDSTITVGVTKVLSQLSFYAVWFDDLNNPSFSLNRFVAAEVTRL